MTHGQMLGLLILAVIAVATVAGLGVLLRLAWRQLPPRNDDASSPLLQRQLALAAIYTVLSPRNDRSLSGWTHGRFRDEIVGMLATTWEVGGPHPQAAMVDQMNAGLHHGHRSDDGLFGLAQEIAEDEGAGDDAPAWAAKALLAWDVARYADLARHGFSVGYLSRAQALDFLQIADDLSREHFSSWADFGAAFVFAKSVFDAQLSEAELAEVSRIDDIRAAVRQLLDQPDSAWRRIPWR